MPTLVGLIPAAGRATRLGLSGTSKEILPVSSDADTPQPVIEFLIGALSAAGVERAFVVLREGKRDIQETIERRRRPEWPRIEYLLTPGTGSIPESVDLAFPRTRDSEIVLGFPDVRFDPTRALADLLDAHRGTACDVTLALFPSDRPDKTDMVEREGGRVTGFRIKPGPCELTHTWILAAWGERFSRFLHEFLRDDDETTRTTSSELQMSEVFAAALASGMEIGAHLVSGGRFIDIGTPDDLQRATASRHRDIASGGESESCLD